MTVDIRELTGLRGHYAGSVSRFLAYAIDLGVISGLFGLVLAAASFASSLITGHTINWNRSSLGVAIAYGCWWFVYFAYSWAVSGKTFGMAVLGVRVVSRKGEVAGPRRAIIRTVVFPLSFLLLGLGFVGILLDRERRALHDVIAGTAVVYMWDARAQRLRFLARDDIVPVPAQPGPPAHETTVTQREAAPPQGSPSGPTFPLRQSLALGPLPLRTAAAPGSGTVATAGQRRPESTRAALALACGHGDVQSPAIGAQRHAHRLVLNLVEPPARADRGAWLVAGDGDGGEGVVRCAAPVADNRHYPDGRAARGHRELIRRHLPGDGHAHPVAYGVDRHDAVGGCLAERVHPVDGHVQRAAIRGDGERCWLPADADGTSDGTRPQSWSRAIHAPDPHPPHAKRRRSHARLLTTCSRPAALTAQ